MTRKPSPLDAAADLRRCIYASFSSQGFNDPNVKTFLAHAQKILNESEGDLNKQVLQMVKQQLKKVQNSKLTPQKRREDLLMAATFLK